MARPKVIHDGFLVPNAATVSHPRMAEPDQVDFNISAQALWGVVEGCLVTVAGSTATTLGGTVVINGVMMPLANSTAQLGVGGTQDRFDLLVADIGGALKVIPGTPSVDPVYPDPPLDCTVLAAVFCPTGLASFTDNVIDKRKLIHKALLTKIAVDAPLVRNMNGSGDHFSIRGDGITMWEDDTSLYRISAGRLRVHRRLWVEEDIAAQSLALSPGGVVAEGTITGSNLLTGDALPGTADNGTIFQHSNGRIYVHKNSGWEELATVSSTVPVGTILTSLQPPSEMTPLGWMPLDGRTVSEAAFPSLFTIAALQPYILVGGVSPNRSMTLPNATGRMLMGALTAGLMGGPPLNQITLQTPQMPRHKHNTRVNTGGGAQPTARTNRTGSHSHVTQGGADSHPVVDPGHQHTWPYGNGPFIVARWNGGNKIDALFNDRNHTWTVDAVDWTAPSVTNISIGSSGSEHGHNLSYEGDHEHVVVVDPIPAHDHLTTEDDIGSNAPIDITPAFLTVITYVRT